MNFVTLLLAAPELVSLVSAFTDGEGSIGVVALLTLTAASWQANSLEVQSLWSTGYTVRNFIADQYWEEVQDRELGRAVRRQFRAERRSAFRRSVPWGMQLFLDDSGEDSSDASSSS